jgi:enoyl-CoA hydratase/carnithine racemase
VITAERDGRIVTFTMRGENDLNLGVMEDALFEALDGYFDDDELWCGILTAAGTRAFSAGADLRQVAGGPPLSDFWAAPRRRRLFEPGGFRKPLIAAVNGHAIGAGMMIAMACDIRIATANATFGLPEVRFGFPPALGATQRLARLIPMGAALQMLMSGASVSAAQAERWGLVNEIVAPVELLPRARALAHQIAGNPPRAVQLSKELVHRAQELGLEQGMRLEQAYAHMARATEDSAEGLRAFVEKRRPVFRNR